MKRDYPERAAKLIRRVSGPPFLGMAFTLTLGVAQ